SSRLVWLRFLCFFFSSRRRHTRSKRDWSSDVCSSDLVRAARAQGESWRAARTRLMPLHALTVVSAIPASFSCEILLLGPLRGGRSEERRVGKECRSRGWTG